MKYIILMLTFVLQYNAFFAQNRTFKLTDTIIAINEYYTTRKILFSPGKAILRPESSIILDSIVNFMNVNKNVIIEIAVHSDSRLADSLCCWKPTESRAETIMQYLIDQGIEKERLTAKGYGGTMALITLEEIKKARTEEEKEAMYAINRRVEMKIIAKANK